MLKIQGTRNYLYQWDLNQKVIVVDNDSVNEVHFANEGQNDNALTVEVKEDSKARYAEIPNILLQSMEWKSIVLPLNYYCNKGEWI